MAGGGEATEVLGATRCHPELSPWRQAGLADAFSALSPDTKRTRPCLARPQVETVCRSYIAHSRCSLGDARRALSAIQLNRHGLTPTRPSKQPWGGASYPALAISTPITRSEVKRRRLEWFAICQPLPGSCWSQKQANNAQATRTGPSATSFEARAMFKRGRADVIAIATNPWTVCVRTAVFPTPSTRRNMAMLQTASREAFAVPERSER